MIYIIVAIIVSVIYALYNKFVNVKSSYIYKATPLAKLLIVIGGFILALSLFVVFSSFSEARTYTGSNIDVGIAMFIAGSISTIVGYILAFRGSR